MTATLALAIAVGGGIAIAGGGSDPKDPHPVVARQAALSLDANESKQMLKLPGLVTLTGNCDGSENGEVEYQSKANSRLSVLGVGANHSSVDPVTYSMAVQPGETGDFGTPGDFTSHHISIFHTNPKKVTPQADLTVEISGCDLRVRALTVKD